MTPIYRKNSKGRYEECGYDVRHDMQDGIWMVQSKPYSKSTTSLVWKVGDLKRPVDVVTIAALESFTDDLTQYLMKLTEEGSDELKEAKDRNEKLEAEKKEFESKIEKMGKESVDDNGEEVPEGGGSNMSKFKPDMKLGFNKHIADRHAGKSSVYEGDSIGHREAVP